MPIENADYFIRVMPFPVAVPAFVRLNDDGTYCIYLNANVPEKWLDGYIHELWHIVDDDLFSEKTAVELEKQRF